MTAGHQWRLRQIHENSVTLISITNKITIPTQATEFVSHENVDSFSLSRLSTDVRPSMNANSILR